MEAFKLFVEKVDAYALHFQEIETYIKKYGLKRFFIEQLTPQQALNLSVKTYEKFYEGKNPSGLLVWYENQLKIFVWVLVCYSLMHLSELENMKEADFLYLEKLFPQKDSRLLDYQHRYLLMGNKNYIRCNPWSLEETQIFKSIKHSNKGKWNQISKQLYFQSNGKYFRPPKQCRERWLNHDNPEKKNGVWNAQECLLMFQMVKQYGKKWAFLSKKLQGSRNQHTIKNKFNSLYKKYKKKHPECSDDNVLDEIIKKMMSIVSQKKQNTGEIENEEEILYSNYELKERKTSIHLEPQRKYFQNMVNKLMKFGSKKEEQSQSSFHQQPAMSYQIHQFNITEESLNKVGAASMKTLIFQESISEQSQNDFFD